MTDLRTARIIAYYHAEGRKARANGTAKVNPAIGEQRRIEAMESEIGVLGNDGLPHDPHAPRRYENNVIGATYFVDDPDQGRVRSLRPISL